VTTKQANGEILNILKRALNYLSLTENRSELEDDLHVDLREAICGIEAIPIPHHQITVTVEGGLIQEIENIPPGISVLVMDFDTDGTDEDEVTKTTEGDLCVVSEWLPDDPTTEGGTQNGNSR
jgi:hypothetical protein